MVSTTANYRGSTRTKTISPASAKAHSFLSPLFNWLGRLGLLGTCLLATAAALADAPVASNVAIAGTAEEGQTLNGSYSYSDAEGDLEDTGATIQRWLRNGTQEVGTGGSYTIQAGDVGNTLVFEVTPVALTETAANELVGIAAQSNPTATVTAPNVAPVAKSSYPSSRT